MAKLSAGEDPDSNASKARLAWIALACIVLLVAAAEVLSATAGSSIDLWALAVIAFPVVGALIASSQPHNAIGWIMLAIGGWSGSRRYSTPMPTSR